MSTEAKIFFVKLFDLNNFINYTSVGSISQVKEIKNHASILYDCTNADRKILNLVTLFW